MDPFEVEDLWLVAEAELKPGEKTTARLAGQLDVEAEVIGVGGLLLTHERVLFVQPTGEAFVLARKDVSGVVASSDDSFLQFLGHGRAARVRNIVDGSPSKFATAFVATHTRANPFEPPAPKVKAAPAGAMTHQPPAKLVRAGPGEISCPKCHLPTKQAGFSPWIWLVAVCFFPMGLLAFVAGRDPTECRHCHNVFKA